MGTVDWSEWGGRRSFVGSEAARLKAMKPKEVLSAKRVGGLNQLLFSGKFELDAYGVPVQVGVIPRPVNVPAPFLKDAEWPVYRYQGEPVVLVEVSQSYYQVFRVADCKF